MPRSHWPRRSISPWTLRVVLVCVAVVCVVQWHAPAPAPLVSQAFIGFIIAAISAVASWIGAAGAAVATATVAVVQYLAGALAWLGAHVGSFLKSTGAMFAKVWDASKRFWFNVVRPAFQHVIKWITEARDWLKQKLGPVFSLLAKIRARVLDFYTRFIRPVLDAIETARGILKLLETLHVPFAKTLDRYLSELESALTENYLWLLSQLNRVTDTLNSVVTFDFLFQRWSFLRTVERDVKYIWQAQMNARSGELTGGDRSSIAARHAAPTVVQMRADFQRFLETSDGPVMDLLIETKARDLVLSMPAPE